MACNGSNARQWLQRHTRVRDLAVGDQVQVPGGGVAAVAAVWRLDVGRSIPMSSIDGVLLTPDHPVCVAGAWHTAGAVAAPAEVEVDTVYNFALAPPCSLLVRRGGDAADANGSKHKNGETYLECCTLGMPVPGIPEPVWGSEEILDVMRAMPGYPNLVTCC
mmetsp:Transcript_54492/g.129444  ORF Transcript_54492/g.129444 Transcript_54492/m.129444 type:complete len:162 (+) Transcript_54492:162-647(+)